MQDEIAEHERKLLKAIKKNDIQELDNLFHQDLLFNTPDGRTLNKSMDLEEHSSGKIKISSIETGNQKIKLIGDTAVVTVTVKFIGKYGDESLEREFRYLRVWKAFGNGFKVIAGSCTPIK